MKNSLGPCSGSCGEPKDGRWPSAESNKGGDNDSVCEACSRANKLGVMVATLLVLALPPDDDEEDESPKSLRWRGEVDWDQEGGGSGDDLADS